MSIPFISLARAARLLAERLDGLEKRIRAGDQAAWVPYLESARALGALLANLPPDRREGFLTTAEMAERLNISPKTLLRRKARGEIRPAVQAGRLIRWKGSELPK